jgi:hypothetical protein
MTDDTTTTTTTDATTTSDAPAQPKIMYGFAVLITEDGNVYVERKTNVFSLEVEREATLLEVRRYASEILMDLQAQSAAEYVVLRTSLEAASKTS